MFQIDVIASLFILHMPLQIQEAFFYENLSFMFVAVQNTCILGFLY
jgi:hypothetical protein